MLSLCATARTAHALRPAVLIDQRLQRHEIQLVGVSEGRVRYFGEDRRLRATPMRDVVRLIFPASPPDSTAASSVSEFTRLRLADGQVLVGRFAGVDPSGRLRWSTPLLGTISVKLANITSFVRVSPGEDEEGGEGAAAAPPQSGAGSKGGDEGGGDAPLADDLVIFTNGDRFTGFILQLTQNGLTLQTKRRAIDIPWQAVARVRLANPPRPTPGVWLTLRSGSRIRVRSLRLSDGRARGRIFADQPLDISITMIRRVDFALDHRLIGLDELMGRVVSGGRVFGVKMAPKIEGEIARLHAPLTMRFELPVGARRFAAHAMLAPEAREHGDLVLSVSDGRGQLVSYRLHAENPKARINVKLRDDMLILRLDPAVNGPILDRMILRKPVVLVELPQ